MIDNEMWQTIEETAQAVEEATGERPNRIVVTPEFARRHDIYDGQVVGDIKVCIMRPEELERRPSGLPLVFGVLSILYLATLYIMSLNHG